MSIRRFEIDNVSVVVEKTITKDGRISGLKKWAGKNAIIVIPRKTNNEGT